MSVGRKRPPPFSSRPAAGDEDEPERHPGASLCRRVGEAPRAAPALIPFSALGCGSGLAPVPAAGWPGRGAARPGPAAWGHGCGGCSVPGGRGGERRGRRALLPPRALRPFGAAALGRARARESRCAAGGTGPSGGGVAASRKARPLYLLCLSARRSGVVPYLAEKHSGPAVRRACRNRLSGSRAGNAPLVSEAAVSLRCLLTLQRVPLFPVGLRHRRAALRTQGHKKWEGRIYPEIKM